MPAIYLGLRATNIITSILQFLLDRLPCKSAIVPRKVADVLQYQDSGLTNIDDIEDVMKQRAASWIIEAGLCP